MDLNSLSRQEEFNTGTVVGIAFVVVAILGTRFLDWEWSAFSSQPVPLVIGVFAAVAGAIIIFQRMTG